MTIEITGSDGIVHTVNAEFPAKLRITNTNQLSLRISEEGQFNKLIVMENDEFKLEVTDW